MPGEQSVEITYNDIDANKMVNKAGLLELSGKIKGYIQANAGGGASYTAGDGIDITNDVISSTVKEFSKDYQPPWFLLFGAIPFTSGLTIKGVSTKDEASDILSHGGSIYYSTFSGNINFTGKELYDMGYNFYYTKNTNGDFVRNAISSSNTSNTITLRYGSGNVYAIGESLVIGSRDDVRAFLLRNLGYDNSISGLTATTIKGAIDELAARPIVSIPTDPTTDGTYVLTSTVSSGTATQTWETASSGGGGGTTYTAGTGIDITNGVISVSLNRAEGGSY